ncbi:MAG: Isoprenylcysteine carboxyl methyltransferase [Chloroflexi bacterium]|jgi:protein-S-isoprenylcysteine O-methyltransferase Ste14|nr:Isoprenylcysteine carboxyl methyltransferase [Chloroflexota bacterium]
MALAATHVNPVTVDAVFRLPLRARVRHPLYWQWIRFLTFGRAVPAALFGEMGWLQIGHVAQASGVLQVLPRLLYLLFCCIPVGLYLTRPMPVNRDGRLVARMAAFGGTCMQLFIGAFVPQHRLLFNPPDALIFVASLLSIAAFAFACLGLGYLRRNLSIIPEARTVVTGGPYRIVRHPLYLAEIGAALALVLAAPYLTPVIALVAFILLQCTRARFEERLLLETLPEYAGYQKRTHALIPFVW